ncbi:MAG: RNA-binding protein [Tannerella sp.]|jgi:RNA recognition motif-containing protein|nr:RNA-binding protein [Tannerella sp.]
MNIYVGNLSYRVREDELKSEMERYGVVDAVRVIKDRDTGRSKGFAFVEMPDDDDARKAIEELNEKELQGRSIVVKESLPRK